MFHVIHLLNDALDTVGIAFQKQLLNDGNEDLYRLVKDSAKLLKTSHFNYSKLWKDKADLLQDRLNLILSLSDDLNTSFMAVQEFHNILSESSFKVQKALLTEWISTYSSCNVTPVVHAARTVRYYRSYIHNSFEYGKSNGPCEGLNQKIKSLKRVGFGSHSFVNFRKRILLSCGSVTFIRDTYSLFEEKHDLG